MLPRRIQTLGEERGDFSVLLAHEWLMPKLDEIKANIQLSSNIEYQLFSHCAEKTALPNSEAQWITIF